MKLHQSTRIELDCLSGLVGSVAKYFGTFYQSYHNRFVTTRTGRSATMVGRKIVNPNLPSLRWETVILFLDPMF